MTIRAFSVSFCKRPRTTFAEGEGTSGSVVGLAQWLPTMDTMTAGRLWARPYGLSRTPNKLSPALAVLHEGTA